MELALAIALLVVAAMVCFGIWARFSTIRAARTRTVVWVWVAATLFAVTLTLPPIAKFMSAPGRQGTNALVVNLLAVVALTALVEVFRVVSLGAEDAARGSRLRYLMSACGAAAMLAGFWFARPYFIDGQVPLWAQPPTPGLLMYWLAFGFVAVSAFTRIGIVAWRVERSSPPSVLRLSMRVMLLSVSLSGASALSGLICLATPFDSVLHKRSAELVMAFLVFATLVAFVSFLLPWFCNTHFGNRLYERSVVRRLRPLWKTLSDSNPQVRLDVASPETNDRDPTVELVRLVVEIHDSFRILNRNLPRDALESAEELARDYRPVTRDAIAAAAWSLAALRLRPREAGALNDGRGKTPGRSSDLDGETEFLLQVAGEIKRQPAKSIAGQIVARSERG
ncbi:MAG: MAB_1171c family putative transporter [Candidatus Nanopelagicales bacterium]